MKQRIVFLLCMTMLALVFTGNASAEENACVNIKGGSGFAAKMKVVTIEDKGDWSGTFNVTETHCKSLKNLKIWGYYEVWLWAQMNGSDPVKCNPVTARSEGKGSTIWRASGTSHISCEAPS